MPKEEKQIEPVDHESLWFTLLSQEFIDSQFIMAKYQKTVFDALIAAGFEEHIAVALTAANLHALMTNAGKE